MLSKFGLGSNYYSVTVILIEIQVPTQSLKKGKQTYADKGTLEALCS